MPPASVAIAPLVLLRLIAGLWVIDTVSLAVPVTVTPSGLVPWSVAVLVIEPASMSACVRVAVPVAVVVPPGARGVVPSISPVSRGRKGVGAGTGEDLGV